jgi:hypothetical protein
MIMRRPLPLLSREGSVVRKVRVGRKPSRVSRVRADGGYRIVKSERGVLGPETAYPNSIAVRAKRLKA